MAVGKKKTASTPQHREAEEKIDLDMKRTKVDREKLKLERMSIGNDKDRFRLEQSKVKLEERKKRGFGHFAVAWNEKNVKRSTSPEVVSKIREHILIQFRNRPSPATRKDAFAEKITSIRGSEKTKLSVEQAMRKWVRGGGALSSATEKDDFLRRLQISEKEKKYDSTATSQLYENLIVREGILLYKEVGVGKKASNKPATPKTAKRTVTKKTSTKKKESAQRS